MLFVVQMDNVSHFEPNRETHPEFADALKDENGVNILALQCDVLPDNITISEEIPIKI